MTEVDDLTLRLLYRHSEDWSKNRTPEGKPGRYPPNGGL